MFILNSAVRRHLRENVPVSFLTRFLVNFDAVCLEICCLRRVLLRKSIYNRRVVESCIETLFVLAMPRVAGVKLVFSRTLRILCLDRRAFKMLDVLLVKVVLAQRQFKRVVTVLGVKSWLERTFAAKQHFQISFLVALCEMLEMRDFNFLV